MSPWRWAEHSAWVVFEDIVLVLGCLQSLREQRALAVRQAELEAAHSQVEEIVANRTEELQVANAALHAEAAVRCRVEDAPAPQRGRSSQARAGRRTYA